VFRRLFTLVVLLAILAGLYYWKFGWKYPSVGFENLGGVGDQLRDTKMTTAVKAVIGLNRLVKPYAIEVRTDKGVVSLQGEVPREDLRSLAEELAGAVPEVREVVNKLKVNPGLTAPAEAERSLGESLDDQTLQAELRMAFSLNKHLSGTHLTVQSYRREVRLSGEVSAESQRHLALKIAADAPGVTGVTDTIRVAGEDAKGGRRVAIERALHSNHNLAGYALEVREEAGRIFLKGHVRTGAEKDLAGLLARDAAGAAVENLIEVRP